MKKNFLTLTICAFGLTVANAQTVKLQEVGGNTLSMGNFTSAAPQELKAETAISRVSSINELAKVRKNIKRAGISDLSVAYGIPDGALFLGMGTTGYTMNAYMCTPSLTDIVFPNYSSWDDTMEAPTFAWTYLAGTETKEMEQDGEGNGIASLFGGAEFPILKATQLGTTVSYSLADDVKSTWTSQSDVTALWFTNSGTYSAMEDEYLSLGNACSGLGVYGGLRTTDNTTVRFTTNENFYNTGKKLVGLVETYTQPQSLIYAKSVCVALFTTDGKALTNGLGGTLTATVYKVSDSGLEVYATATATDENVTAVGDQGLTYIEFPFMEEDDLFGDVEAPIVLDGSDFMVQITGFETLNKSFIAPFSGGNGDPGNAYALLEDGTLETIGYSNMPEMPSVNLFIGFNAAMPLAQLVDEDAEIVFPEEGGVGSAIQLGNSYDNISIYTLSDAENWQEISMPDWIDGYDKDDSRASSGTLVYSFSAEALPAGVEGRSGEIVLELFGKQVVIPVSQGDVAAGINGVEDVEKVNTNAPVYNLNGQRVAKNTKGILIQNGKKFIQK